MSTHSCQFESDRPCAACMQADWHRPAGSFALATSPLFVADDADGRPCVWIDAGNANGPDVLLRSIDIPAVGRDALWAHIAKGLPTRRGARLAWARQRQSLSRWLMATRKRADS